MREMVAKDSKGIESTVNHWSLSSDNRRRLHHIARIGQSANKHRKAIEEGCRV